MIRRIVYTSELFPFHGRVLSLCVCAYACPCVCLLLQTSGVAEGSDQDVVLEDGLDLYELADVLVQAGAVNAINLLGGGPAAMTVNSSAVVDPTGQDCSHLGSGSNDVPDEAIGFSNGSTLARCESPVSSVVCLHLQPPPFVPGYGHDQGGISSGSNASGSDGNDDEGGGNTWASWSGSDGHDGERDAWGQRQEEYCGPNATTGNGTLWEHLEDVEEAVFRYKVRHRGIRDMRSWGRSREITRQSTMAWRSFVTMTGEVSK